MLSRMYFVYQASYQIKAIRGWEASRNASSKWLLSYWEEVIYIKEWRNDFSSVWSAAVYVMQPVIKEVFWITDK